MDANFNLQAHNSNLYAENYKQPVEISPENNTENLRQKVMNVISKIRFYLSISIIVHGLGIIAFGAVTLNPEIALIGAVMTILGIASTLLSHRMQKNKPQPNHVCVPVKITAEQRKNNVAFSL